MMVVLKVRRCCRHLRRVGEPTFNIIRIVIVVIVGVGVEVGVVVRRPADGLTVDCSRCVVIVIIAVACEHSRDRADNFEPLALDENLSHLEH